MSNVSYIADYGVASKVNDSLHAEVLKAVEVYEDFEFNESRLQEIAKEEERFRIGPFVFSVKLGSIHVRYNGTTCNTIPVDSDLSDSLHRY